MILSDGKKIIQATLEAVKIHGVHAVTHRKIAAIAQVPLGSMTYYFAGMDALLSEAFTLFTENMSRQYQDFFAQVTDAQGGVPGDNGNDLRLAAYNAG